MAYNEKLADRTREKLEYWIQLALAYNKIAKSSKKKRK
jgi:hypothetical protein